MDIGLAILGLRHPGKPILVSVPETPDETLAANAAYVEHRREELEILRDPRLAEEARRRGVELISFLEI